MPPLERRPFKKTFCNALPHAYRRKSGDANEWMLRHYCAIYTLPHRMNEHTSLQLRRSLLSVAFDLATPRPHGRPHGSDRSEGARLTHAGGPRCSKLSWGRSLSYDIAFLRAKIKIRYFGDGCAETLACDSCNERPLPIPPLRRERIIGIERAPLHPNFKRFLLERHLKGMPEGTRKFWRQSCI